MTYYQCDHYEEFYLLDTMRVSKQVKYYCNAVTYAHRGQVPVCPRNPKHRPLRPFGATLFFADREPNQREINLGMGIDSDEKP